MFYIYYFLTGNLAFLLITINLLIHCVLLVISIVLTLNFFVFLLSPAPSNPLTHCSRYKYFDLPNETNLPDILTPGPVCPMWQLVGSQGSYQSRQSPAITIPTTALPYLTHVGEERDVFSRLMPHSVSQKNNLNNSARDSVDLNEDLMRNLNLDDLDGGSNSSYHNGGYIPYRLSRAENYEDDLADHIEMVAAENRSGRQNSPDDEYDDASEDQSKDDTRTSLLHQRLCSKTGTRAKEDDIVLEDAEQNMNNNANGSDTMKMRRTDFPSEYDIDLAQLGCEIQTSRSGRLPVALCSHKTKQRPCPQCGHTKPDLKVRDVKFLYWTPPPRKLVIKSPETKKSGVLYRYSGLAGGKKTMDPNPSPASTSTSSPASTPRYNKTEVINIIRDCNTAASPLPAIMGAKRSFYIQTPRNARANQRSSSNQSLSLPKVDTSPKTSLVSLRNEDNGTPMSNRDAIMTPDQTPRSRIGMPQHTRDGKVKQYASPPSRQGVLVQNNQKYASVRMHYIPPHYRNSFHGSFIPHSLLKARVPLMTSRQRMEQIRSRKFRPPSYEKIMVEMRLDSPSKRIDVFRKNVSALKKYANM